MNSNTIAQAQYGIDYGCSAGSNVANNTISFIHNTGIIDVPSGVNSPNIYYVVPTLYSGC